MKACDPPARCLPPPFDSETDEWLKWVKGLQHRENKDYFEELPPTPSEDTHVSLFCLRTGRLTCSKHFIIEDAPGDHTFPVYSFLIEHRKGDQIKRVLFDLGLRSPESKMSAQIKDMYTRGFNTDFEADIPTILEENGVDLASVDSIALSHLHWDHHGKIASFPKSVELVLGLDTDPETLAQELDCDQDALKGRKIRILNRQDQFCKIGVMQGVDYFGDGTFMLIDLPGHKIGHMAALVRIDGGSYYLLGGDLCHHCDLLCSNKGMSKPKLGIWRFEKGPRVTMHMNPEATYGSISKAERMDKDPRICVFMAHDTRFEKVVGNSRFFKVDGDIKKLLTR